MENKCTFTEYTFPNGEKVKCTVAFIFLLKLREKNERIYKILNNCILNGMNDMTEAVYVLYGAYLCACYAGENGDAESIMTENDFIAKLDDDIMNVFVTCSRFLEKKKN